MTSNSNRGGKGKKVFGLTDKERREISMKAEREAERAQQAVMALTSPPSAKVRKTPLYYANEHGIKAGLPQVKGWEEEWIDKWDAEIMWWFYDILKYELGVEMAHDSTELRKMLKRALKKALHSNREEVKEIIKRLYPIWEQTHRGCLTKDNTGTTGAWYVKNFISDLLFKLQGEQNG